MDKNPVEIIQREMLVFLFLSVVNIIFSAIALATGIVFLVNHLPAILNNPMMSSSFFYVFSGFPLAIIGIFWIVNSVTLMDFMTEKQFGSADMQKNDPSERTSMIITMLSYYRLNGEKIKRMIIISRIGGIFFLMNGIISSVDLINSVSSESFIRPVQVLTIILVFIWGFASLIIPIFVKKFAYIWELRLDESKKAEQKIKNFIEGH